MRQSAQTKGTALNCKLICSQDIHCWILNGHLDFDTSRLVLITVLIT